MGWLIAGVVLELGVLAGLVWKVYTFHNDGVVTGWEIALILAIGYGILYLVFAFLQWAGLRKHVTGGALARLVFITGPAIFLSMSLIFEYTGQLEGGSTKPRAARSSHQIISESESISADAQKERLRGAGEQWWLDDERTMRSERILLAVLAGSLLVSYGRTVQVGKLGRSNRD